MVDLAHTVISQVEPLIRDVVKHQGMELVDVTYQRESHGWVLRVFIDRHGGVSVEDCSEVSSQLSDILDVYDVIPHRYLLEVSSPGMNRPLKNERDFKRFLGSTVRVITNEAIENQRRFKGVLRSCDNGMILLEEGSRQWQIPLQHVRKAHLDQNPADFWMLGKREKDTA